MQFPAKNRIQKAIHAMEKMHYAMGYRTIPHDLEYMMWAALFALWNDWESPNERPIEPHEKIKLSATTPSYLEQRFSKQPNAMHPIWDR